MNERLDVGSRLGDARRVADIDRRQAELRPQQRASHVVKLSDTDEPVLVHRLQRRIDGAEVDDTADADAQQ